MKRKLLIIVTISISIAVVGYGLALIDSTRRARDGIPRISDPRNATYTIDGVAYTLVSGLATKEVAPGSASVSRVSLFGEPIMGDLNGDGVEDAVVMLVYDGGGSGTFFYAALALNDQGNFRGTNALFLGDRIAPQTIEIHDGRAVVNIVERSPGESFAVEPSVTRSVRIVLDERLGVITEDPSRQ